MAFGKDPKGLGNVGSFRQMGHAFNQQRAEKKHRPGGGGGAPSWVNEYRPPTDDVHTIRVLAGSYSLDESDGVGGTVKTAPLPFFPFVEHYDSRTKKRCNCSAGPNANDRKLAQPCHGCDLFWSSMKTNPNSGKKEKGFMGKRDMIAFSMFDYGRYHKVEQVDFKTGQVRRNDSGQPYYNWVRCSKDADGMGPCDACDANKDTKSGHRMHWPMGSDHYNVLLNSDEDIGKCCATCGGRDTIRSEAWLCPNPACGEAIIDSSSRMKKADIDEVTNKLATCRHCGQSAFLQEMIACKNCTPIGNSPRRATIFDVDLRVRRIEPADGSNRTTLNVVGFSDPHPVDKMFAEFAKPEDLAKIYAPTPLDRQAIIFQVLPGGREPVTASTAARPYGQGGGGPNYGG